MAQSQTFNRHQRHRPVFQPFLTLLRTVQVSPKESLQSDGHPIADLLFLPFRLLDHPYGAPEAPYTLSHDRGLLETYFAKYVRYLAYSLRNPKPLGCMIVW
jgi:hypothetical protein